MATNTILNSLLLGLGVVTAQIPHDASEETFIKRALENAMHSGDLSRMALEHAGKDRLSRTNKHIIIQKAQAGISNLVLLINDIESRTKGVSPILSYECGFSRQWLGNSWTDLGEPKWNRLTQFIDLAQIYQHTALAKNKKQKA